MMMEEELPPQAAVMVRAACLSYGSKSKPHMVLDHLNMTVPRGSIYGLLGASGCGKTSLLTCMVGLRKLNAGHMCVLGGEPGSPGSGVPGPRVGYMPQDIALMGDFTISNTMFYFGRIFGMSYRSIEERAEFLNHLLALPPEDTFVGQLSGGQQRRVSLAAALLHDPELLILDEPTVGLDPLLRQRIWDYLKEITRMDNKSVIITTHYIEEARQADMIGLMRKGKLLAEDTPVRLLERHGCSTLELVFLELSRAQTLRDEALLSPVDAPQHPETVVIDHKMSASTDIVRTKPAEPPGAIATVLPSDELVHEVTAVESCNTKKPLPNRSSSFGIMHSLLKKNFLRYIRNKSTMAYVFGFPILQIVVFFLAIGHDPQKLPLAVVNGEVPAHLAGMCEPVPDCNMTRLSCRFLAQLSPDIISLRHFASKDSALAAVRAGKAWGALSFGSNFSSALTDRYEQGVHTTNMTLDEGEIDVWLDMTDHHIGLLLKKTILETYRTFSRNLLVDCGLSGKHGDVPMQFGTPVYGSRNPSYTLFMAPGVILTVVFFLGVGVTCTTMVSEITDGIWNRALVSGVSTGEILMSHVITQFVLMLVQTAECLLLSFPVFGVMNHGSLTLTILLTILEGFCGISYGILISVVCDTMTSAIYLGVGSFFPMLMLCGITWPVQGMPHFLRVFCEQLPLTSGSTSLRNILGKGWGLEYPEVYKGFAVTIVWTLGFLLACLIGLRLKK